MIIGRGLLASALRGIDDDSYLFYANGISNSVLEDIPRNNFEIEEVKRISIEHRERIFIYFSTSQVNSELNHDRAYVKHKLYIEELIKRKFENYLIIRTSNLVGFNPWNQHTLFNYLYHALTVNEQITVNPILERNFLDVSHFTSLLKNYLENYDLNQIVEIVNPLSFTMNQLISDFEKCFSKRFHLKKESGKNDFAVFELNTKLSKILFKNCNISIDNYIPRLLKKYYVDSPVKNLNY